MSFKSADLIKRLDHEAHDTDVSDLEAQLASLQKESDFAGLAKLYYNMGARCMDAEDYDRAMMYLSRADNIYTSDDGIYEQVGEELIDDCAERICRLDELPTFTTLVLHGVQEAAKNLDETQVRIAGLLTLARFVKLGERLSFLPGCESLGELGEIVSLIMRSFHEPLSKDDFLYLKDFCDDFYEFTDSECFFDINNQAETPCGAPVQVFDLNGLTAMIELNLYLDSHLSLFAEDKEPEVAECDFIPAALLPDYYLRTSKKPLADNPHIQKELERIQSDLEFISERPSWESIAKRAAEYAELDILL